MHKIAALKSVHRHTFTYMKKDANKFSNFLALSSLRVYGCITVVIKMIGFAKPMWSNQTLQINNG